jgi:hypothetical protein
MAIKKIYSRSKENKIAFYLYRYISSIIISYRNIAHHGEGIYKCAAFIMVDGTM